MRTYEGLFIFPPESGPETRKEEAQALENHLKKFKAVVKERVEWGKRSLGYPLKKYKEGYVIVVEFTMGPEHAQEFRRTLELDERILKFMFTVRTPQALQQATQKAAKAAAVRPPYKAAIPTPQPQPTATTPHA